MEKGRKGTIKNVEDVARDSRWKGHKSPVCRETIDAKDLYNKRGVYAKEKTVAH